MDGIYQDPYLYAHKQAGSNLIRKIKNKYLIIECLSYAGNLSFVKQTMGESCKHLRRLLTANL